MKEHCLVAPPGEGLTVVPGSSALSAHTHAVTATVGHHLVDRTQPKHDVLRSGVKILYLYFRNMSVS